MGIIPPQVLGLSSPLLLMFRDCRAKVEMRRENEFQKSDLKFKLLIKASD